MSLTHQFQFFQFRSQCLFFIVIGAIVTLIFWFIPLDLRVAALYYDFELHHWIGDHNQFLIFIYRFGVLPMTLVFLFALLKYILVFTKPSSKINRTRLLCIILITILGPGLMINLILKKNYNRPRPYQLEQFQGTLKYHYPLQIATEGESFPSGHASGGFALTILFYLFYQQRKKLAYFCFIFALFNGALLGWARIAQGGHFLSDILFSFLVMQLINITVFFKILKVQEKVHLTDQHILVQTRKGKIGMYCIFLFLSTTFIISTLFSFPFKVEKESIIPFKNHSKEVQDIEIMLKKNNSSVQIQHQKRDDILIKYTSIGTGLPWSSFQIEKQFEMTQQGMNLMVNVIRNAYQWEYNGHLLIVLPENINVKNKIIND